MWIRSSWMHTIIIDLNLQNYRDLKADVRWYTFHLLNNKLVKEEKSFEDLFKCVLSKTFDFHSNHENCTREIKCLNSASFIPFLNRIKPFCFIFKEFNDQLQTAIKISPHFASFNRFKRSLSTFIEGWIKTNNLHLRGKLLWPLPTEQNQNNSWYNQ